MNLHEEITRINEMMNPKGWGNSTEKLSKNYKFNSFEESMDFINKVAKIAEKQNHHPKITVDYDKVNLTITDHEKGKVSEKCHKFVDAVDKIK